MSHSRTMVFALAVTVALPGPARADRKSEAEKLAAAGEALFEAGKYQDALRQFLDAYARFDPPRFVIPEVIWNIGRCYEELGDDTAAIRYFEEFREVATDPGYRQKADAKLKALRERMRAALAIEVEPEGTQVTVDGRAVGEAPLVGPLRLEPGEHVVVFTREGYRDRKETVTLKAREARTLKVALERKVGTVRVVGVGGPPTGPVQVLVDGREAYRGSLPARVEVPAGQRVVRVEGPEGTQPVLRYVEVPDRGEVEVAKAFPVPRPVEVAPPPRKQEPSPTPTVTARPGAGFPWHFVVIGSGAAMLAGGGVMTALAAKDRAKVSGADRAPDGTVTGITQASASSAASSARTKDKVSYALYGVGGAAVVGGVLWWVLRSGEGGENAAISPVPSAVAVEGGALVGAVGRF